MQVKRQKSRLRTKRIEIDKIDRQIGKLLAKREQKITEIVKIKRSEGIPVINMEVEKNKLKKFNSTFQKNIFRKIFIESRNLQAKLLTNKGKFGIINMHKNKNKWIKHKNKKTK